MEPIYALNRSYWDSPDDCLQQWLDAYGAIGRKHPELAPTVDRLVERIHLAYSLYGGLANLGGMPDDTAYAQRVADEAPFHRAAKDLDGDFPLGNEREVWCARCLFSIREMAWMQAGLGRELDPDDLGEVPEGKVFSFDDPQYTPDEQRQERAALLDELAKKYQPHPA
ncbi:MAG: hypothetical protein IJ524_07845 [Bacteroidales bacterium]|nr:hypothetical protein [Bacteroidales bacterium]